MKLAPEELGHTCDSDIAAEPVNGPGTGAQVSRDVPDVSPAPLDVWPTEDLSVRAPTMPPPGNRGATPKALDALGDPFRPYRSVVAYCTWKGLGRPGSVRDQLGDGGQVTSAPAKIVQPCLQGLNRPLSC